MAIDPEYRMDPSGSFFHILKAVSGLCFGGMESPAVIRQTDQQVIWTILSDQEANLAGLRMFETIAHGFFKNHQDVSVIISRKFQVFGSLPLIFIAESNACILEYLDAHTFQAPAGLREQ